MVVGSDMGEKVSVKLLRLEHTISIVSSKSVLPLEPLKLFPHKMKKSNKEKVVFLPSLCFYCWKQREKNAMDSLSRERKKRAQFSISWKHFALIADVGMSESVRIEKSFQRKVADWKMSE